MKFYTQVCSSDVKLGESFVTWSKQQSGHSSEEAHIVVWLDLGPFDFTVQGLVGRGWLIWKNNQLLHYSLSLLKKKKFVLGSIHQNEQNISLSWAVCRAWETRVKLKTFQPLSKESWYPSLREMVQHVPKCIYLYILMKVINYCSISYCNCTYLLNNPILAHAFGLRLLATYEDVHTCMTETSRG